MTELDLWAAENEPVVSYNFTTYHLTLADAASRKRDEVPHVYVEVDEYGLVNISGRTVWFGNQQRIDEAEERHSRSYHSLVREILDWLIEWEFAEWRSIGPEDREVFATKKLTGKEYE